MFPLQWQATASMHGALRRASPPHVDQEATGAGVLVPYGILANTDDSRSNGSDPISSSFPTSMHLGSD